jgi:hypothetical protein
VAATAESSTSVVDVPSAAPARDRREEAAVAVFGTWMIIGLFIDGWAHQADKPETFFTPWHGVLYSGFVVAVVWFAWEGRRQGTLGLPSAAVPGQRLTALGFVVFVTGAVADGLWHEIFGVEVDLEALLSPTHLLLLIGGFLMVTQPIRAAWADTTDDAGSMRAFWPQAVTLTLATALVSFFTMYLSAFVGVADERGSTDRVQELLQVEGLASILVTNVIMIVPLVFTLRRWRPPMGTFTVLFAVVALAMTGLEAFDRAELAAPAVLAGLTADIALRRLPVRAVAAVVPLVLWTAYFAVAQASYGVEWPPELVAGSVVLATMSGLLLAVFMGPAPLRHGQ